MLKIILVLLLLAFVGLAYRPIVGEGTGRLLARRFGPSLCRLAGHRRRGNAVRKIDDVYLSRCRRCGVRLSKASREGAWLVVADDEAETPAEQPRRSRDRQSAANLFALIAVGAGVALTIGLMAAPTHLVMRSTPGEAPSRLAGLLARI